MFFGRLGTDLSNNWGGYVITSAVDPYDENAVCIIFNFQMHRFVYIKQHSLSAFLAFIYSYKSLI